LQPPAPRTVTMTTRQFPADFVWGVATSAYQIEGAATEDGRGESIWDRFAATAGKIADGSSGAVACDHYHRYREDIGLISELGLRAYRFSVAWPRVMPTGRGAINQHGLDFYDRLVDGLLRAGIEPTATLYHWDLPQALEDQGGWLARGTAEAFVAYAEAVVWRLGDRVKRWITHNEPWCAAVLGYGEGVHAPGRCDAAAALTAAHHLLLSHGWAVPVIRQHSPEAEVGITLNMTHVIPASPSDADATEARQIDGAINRWYLDPLYGRGYPADMLAHHAGNGTLPGPALPCARAGDMEAIATPCDFLGINYYTRAVARSREVPEPANEPRTVFLAPPSEHTDIGWEVYPDGLRELLLRVHREYHPARLYVTENGAAYSTPPDASGRVPDEARVRYLRAHFLAAHRAIAAGVPLHGYFVWSLMDNFEWAYGYDQRFGIVWVDYASQRRLLKDSARYLRQVVRDNGL
jgi:beta-glucosidase